MKKVFYLLIFELLTDSATHTWHETYRSQSYITTKHGTYYQLCFCFQLSDIFIHVILLKVNSQLWLTTYSHKDLNTLTAIWEYLDVWMWYVPIWAQQPQNATILLSIQLSVPWTRKPVVAVLAIAASKSKPSGTCIIVY